jgi:endoglycosylceramidase
MYGRAIATCFLFCACVDSTPTLATPPSPLADGSADAPSTSSADAGPVVVALDGSSHDAAVVEWPRLAAPREVAGGFMRDSFGRSVVLRGVNLTGKNKVFPYLDQKTAADFDRVRSDWGMNVIRLVTTWAAIEPTQDGYDDAFLDALALRVEWAQKANVLVIVDMHQDVYGEGFSSGGGDGAPRWTCDASHYANFAPAVTWTANYVSAEVRACYDQFWTSDALQAHYAEAWRRIAKRLARYDNVVGFDVMNEPFFGTYLPTSFEHDRVMPLYERVVPLVRKEAPGWIAFLEPSSARNFTGLSALPKPTFAHFVFAPHSYDSLSELGVPFDAARRSKVVDNVAALWQEAQSLGGGLWIGEYGGVATLPGIVDYMNAQYEGMSAVAASATYWDYSGSYGLIGDDGNEQPSIVDSVVRPYPEAIAGTPLGWTFDAATRAFSVRYQADANITAPTVLSLPARAFPNGFQVLCVGCSAVQSGAYAIITKPPTGDPAVISVRP